MWFRPDVLYQYGGSHLKRKLRFDALGRPFVYMRGGEISHLLPNGRSSYGNSWTPLSKRAADVYTTFEKSPLQAVA